MPRAKRRRHAPEVRSTGRWIGYLRVSTTKQGLSVEAQGHAINAEAQRRGVPVCVYLDNGTSGTLRPERRDGLSGALAELAEGRADGLIVAKLDRLGRNASDVTTIVDLAREQGWTLVILDPALDLSTTAGRMVANMLAAVAEMEAEMIEERTAAIVERKREQGKSLGGRPRALPADVAARISGMRAERMTLQAIADALNAEEVPTAHGGARWYPSTVSHALDRERLLDEALGPIGA